MTFKLSEKRLHDLNLALFSVTMFVSAALMFGLQPMIGKMLLPLVGGTPAGWIVAMAFFQVMLLVGYFFAHALSQLEHRLHGMIYVLALAFGLVFLPVTLTQFSGLIGETPMAFDVFLLLTIVVAMPFVALSATASTVQRLFTASGHASAKDPYFLYAASNLGSFAGLLLYPFVIESRTTLTAQANGWANIYLLLIALAGACLFVAHHKAKNKPVKKPLFTAPWKKNLEWAALAFVPSGLLLAVTTYITTDILSVPMLWVLPLSLYLLTFVIAFSRRSFVSYDTLLTIHPAAVAVGLSVSLALMTKVSLAATWYALILHLVVLAVVALMCHTRLAHTRPVEDSRQLTDFYLMMALGGALGGISCAFVAPAVFNTLAEYPVMLLLSCLLNDNIRARFTDQHLQTLVVGGVVLLALAAGTYFGRMDIMLKSVLLITGLILVMQHPRLALISGTVISLGVAVYLWRQPSVMIERNFYGVVKVYDKKEDFTWRIQVPKGLNIPPMILPVRTMQHGTTTHGFQILKDQYETTPTSYYTREGPLGDVMSMTRPKNVAAVGLGTGTINCYSTPERNITFFEIDPAVVRMTIEHFTFLSKCGTKSPPIVMGDARLEIKKYKGAPFDLIVLDAFSSDMVPTHLLTKEALQVYLDKLGPRGVIALHVSNRYFDLKRTLYTEAQEMGLSYAHVLQGRSPVFYGNASEWVVLSRPDMDLSPLLKAGWDNKQPDKASRAWTDDYTDLLGTLNFL